MKRGAKMSYIKEIVRDGYKAVFEEPELYVDNYAREAPYRKMSPISRKNGTA